MDTQISADIQKSGFPIYIYKCERKQGSFLYLPEKDSFEALPQTLLDLLGKLSFSFEFVLTHNRKLVQVDTKAVIKSILVKGYFLQLAPSSKYIPVSIDDSLPSGF